MKKTILSGIYACVLSIFLLAAPADVCRADNEVAEEEMDAVSEEHTAPVYVDLSKMDVSGKQDIPYIDIKENTTERVNSNNLIILGGGLALFFGAIIMFFSGKRKEKRKEEQRKKRIKEANERTKKKRMEENESLDKYIVNDDETYHDEAIESRYVRVDIDVSEAQKQAVHTTAFVQKDGDGHVKKEAAAKPRKEEMPSASESAEKKTADAAPVQSRRRIPARREIRPLQDSSSPSAPAPAAAVQKTSSAPRRRIIAERPAWMDEPDAEKNEADRFADLISF